MKLNFNNKATFIINMLIWYFVHVLTRRLIFWIYYKWSQFKNIIQVVKISMYLNGSDYINNSSASKNKTQYILFKCNYMLKYSLRPWNF